MKKLKDLTAFYLNSQNKTNGANKTSPKINRSFKTNQRKTFVEKENNLLKNERGKKGVRQSYIKYTRSEKKLMTSEKTNKSRNSPIVQSAKKKLKTYFDKTKIFSFKKSFLLE